jgi:hypothetical protein
MPNSWKWYGVQTLYRTAAIGKPLATDKHYSAAVTMVEHRTVIFRARSFDEAIRKAEKNAKSYAAANPHRNPYGQRVKTRYLGFCNAFVIYDHLESGAEVHSETEVIPRRITDSQVCSRPIGSGEPPNGSSLRQNILDIELAGPVSGVKLTKKELAFVEMCRSLLKRHDA